MEYIPVYKPRHISEAQLSELYNLYHLARTALSGQACTPYDRMLWASAQFAKANPGVSATAAYKDLSSSRA